MTDQHPRTAGQTLHRVFEPHTIGPITEAYTLARPATIDLNHKANYYNPCRLHSDKISAITLAAADPPRITKPSAYGEVIGPLTR